MHAATVKSGRRWKRGAAAVGVSLAMAGLLAAGQGTLAGASGAGVYRQTNLVSDIPGVARKTDPNLVNPWGMAELGDSPLWVADNNANVATIYVGDQEGSPLIARSLVVGTDAGPTGQVAAGIPNQFVVTNAGKTGPAFFIFSSESGNISAWNGAGDAKIVRSRDHAVYKGLAIKTGTDPKLYATNFHDGTIDVFDGTFTYHANAPGHFVDPNLPVNYAPFGINNINGKLYVTYALQKLPDRHDDDHGPHRGFVDVYSLDGVLQKRLVSMGALNSPWGLVKATEEFGRFSNALLVGNFGDGTINAYDINTGQMKGTLTNPDGDPIAINGLWGLIYGNKSAGTPNTLFFSAGIADEAHGLLGSITPAGD
jgi:uncharacterized protein (TIGR03118 family)